MNNKKVLFVSQKIFPYLPEDEMSVICRNLPQGIQERGKEIRTFMPKFGSVNERRNQLHEVIRLSGMNLIIDDTDHPLIIKVASIQSARMQVYFIDNEDYFHRSNVFSDSKGKEYKDNDERAIFFARGVLETVKKLRWAPDIIHCHGWFTSLVPLYVKKTYHDDPLFTNSRIVYSVYNDTFNNPLNSSFGKKLMLEGITEEDVSVLDNNPDFINVTKLGILHSDAVIQGSKTVEEEVSKYIKKSGKPFLSYKSEEEYLDAFSTFYDNLLMESLNEPSK